ncbi:MAG: class I SAM-dependent rRNA methyltransferase [Chloroherpetonaceae bacterium]|nr:class I SAM-dependent rRNA methyltransferase [Chloroherpetonaceae bacterium]MCS7210675.1 class I SAM-dependent rRNA methyltransferase [Chloroherpetonaceae bacterium]MDW8020939.1 class I SAM-dependent rRNA methyltransferase [Chloroherpetonaceae bacterium]MDW8464849.1 class I SAM-dependent rRNA methyltransferase [Chloroherpetonaceae bacterium]
MKKIRLKKNEERRLLAGHQWVFSNEILEADPAIETGEVVSLYSFSRQFLGIGFFNRHSLIAFRHLSWHDEPIDKAFFLRRLEAALQLRRRLYPDSETNTYRLVHAESDRLPGLIVDRFADVLSVQTFSAGMEQRLDEICAALETLLAPKAIVIRNESELRKLEGLSLYQRIASGTVDAPIEIFDADLTYQVDVLRGHKTGFFLDQRENRKRIRKFAYHQRVLDVFCSDGGFALNALRAGAAEVVAMDSSADALARARCNAARNGFSQLETIEADAFDYLAKLLERKAQFDLIILDPPSLTKSKKTLQTAVHAYRKLNRLAMGLLRPGGILATASCSHHLTEEMFVQMLAKAAQDAARCIQILEQSTQAPDHPILPAMPETRYLKFALLYVQPAS